MFFLAFHTNCWIAEAELKQLTLTELEYQLEESSYRQCSYQLFKELALNIWYEH